MHSRTRSEAIWGTAALIGVAAWACTGCDSEMAKEFREASGAQLESGVDTVVDGLLDGVFTLWDPDTSSSSDSGS